MKTDSDKDLDEIYRKISNTNCILDAISDLSKKMDENQKQEEVKQKKQARKDTIFFVISTVIGLLTLGATVLFGIIG